MRPFLEMKSKNKPARPKPTAPADYAAINRALERHLDLAWTEANQQTIKREIGPDNFVKVQEIMSFTSNQDAWLNDYSLSSAADKVSGKLSQRYPLLSPGAAFRIINQATYGWR